MKKNKQFKDQILKELYEYKITSTVAAVEKLLEDLDSSQAAQVFSRIADSIALDNKSLTIQNDLDDWIPEKPVDHNQEGTIDLDDVRFKQLEKENGGILELIHCTKASVVPFMITIKMPIKNTRK